MSMVTISLVGISLLAAPAVTVPGSVSKGDIFVIRSSEGEQKPAGVDFMGQHYPAIMPRGWESPFFLLGVDLEAPAGTFPVAIHFEDPVRRTENVTVVVREREFPVERLTLPPDMVTPPPEVQKRIGEERKAAARVYRTTAPGALWEPPFAMPSSGKPSGNFGRKRILNGLPRSPHSGEDYSAPRGAEVKAAAGGRVAMARDLYYSGQTVLIDHGAGLVSQYFHLDEILVEEGKTVEKGEVVGKVGSTGRVTGPHLHFGIRLYEKRIDPSTLWDLFR